MIRRIWRDKWARLLLVLDTLAIICLFIVYGPFHFFRDFYITSAMATHTHQYLAYIFYGDKTVSKTMSENYVIGLEGNSNLDDIDLDFNSEYKTKYDKEILEHDKDELYKLIEIDEDDLHGYLVAVYEPKRISLFMSKYHQNGGQSLTSISKSSDAIVAVNASGLSYRNGGTLPTGYVIDNGEIINYGLGTGYGRGLIGFNKDGILMLFTGTPEDAIAAGMNDGVTFGPFLILNGQSAIVKGNGGLGYAPRTAIAQRKDGIVLFLVMEGRSVTKGMGASMTDLIEILLRYGAYNASNLDGGGSSMLAINHELINTPAGWGYTGQRALPNAWILK